MIIWGTRGLTRKGKTGRFFCPQCDGERNYQGVKVQRFFTLYFIPLIPLDVVYESVKCEVCSTEYKPSVLQYDPRAEREEAQREINRGVLEILLSFDALSGSSAPERFEAIHQHLVAMDCQDFTPDQIANLAAQGRMDMAHTAARIAPRLTDLGRENLVQGALAASTAGRGLTPEIENRLSELAKAVGMSEVHLRGVIAGHAPANA